MSLLGNGDGAADDEYPGHVRLAAIYFTDTAKAVKVDAGTKTLWVPKSQMPVPLRERFPDEEGDQFTLVVSEWFARKEGLI